MTSKAPNDSSNSSSECSSYDANVELTAETMVRLAAVLPHRERSLSDRNGSVDATRTELPAIIVVSSATQAVSRPPTTTPTTARTSGARSRRHTTLVLTARLQAF